MKKETSNRVNMIRTTVNFCDENPAPTAGIPAFATIKTTIKNKLVFIDTLNQIAGGTSKGVTLNTNIIRNTMQNIAFKCGSGVSAFAASINDNELLFKVDFSLTDLERLKKEDIDDTCQTIHDEANTNIATAGDFGYTAADVTDLQTAIDLYRVSMQHPRQVIITQNDAKKEIDIQVREITTNLLKKQLDKIVNTLKFTQTEYVRQYFAAREIIDLAGPGEGNVTLSGTLTDNVTGEPIADAEFVVGPYTFTTAADGSFIKKLQIDEPTTYDVTITADDYEPIETTYQFTPNVNLTQDVQMTPEAEVGSMSGAIKDAGTLLGLAGGTVNLTAPGVSIIITADANGNFNKSGIPVGTYTATANVPGYTGQSISVTINANSNTVQNFSLVPIP